VLIAAPRVPVTAMELLRGASGPQHAVDWSELGAVAFPGFDAALGKGVATMPGDDVRRATWQFIGIRGEWALMAHIYAEDEADLPSRDAFLAFVRASAGP
jgi:hypothetical protein